MNVIDRSESENALPCGSYSPRWYIVRTHWGEEAEAARRIVDQGFIAFLPEEIVELTRKARHRDRDRIAVDAHGRLGKRMPMFPRYLFVFFDADVDRWRPICSTRGVERLFGETPERPSAVPDGIVEKFLRDPDISAVFTPPPLEGKMLRVTNGGPWHQFEGICQKSSDRRVEILMSVFGRDGSVVPFDRSHVEVIEEAAA